MAKYTQGIFRPLHPEKYKGNPTNIAYRSSWELTCMSWFDKHPSILEWSSEELIVQYRSPIDSKIHRYFPDFVIKKKDKEGKISTIMIEVKPKKQTIPPKIQAGKKKASRQYLNEVMTWGINSSKWNAARAFCAKRGWHFTILTEDDIGVLS